MASRLAGIHPSIIQRGFVGPYDRKGLYSVESVLSQVNRDHPVIFDGDSMSMGSQRYYTFLKSLECCKCGLVGVFFAKERSAKTIKRPDGSKYQVAISEPYHFNLYAVRKFEPKAPHKRLDVLMTKDHIIPRSKGGPDELDNYRTMCSPCNGKRGNKDIA